MDKTAPQTLNMIERLSAEHIQEKEGFRENHSTYVRVMVKTFNFFQGSTLISQPICINLEADALIRGGTSTTCRVVGSGSGLAASRKAQHQPQQRGTKSPDREERIPTGRTVYAAELQ